MEATGYVSEAGGVNADAVMSGDPIVVKLAGREFVVAPPTVRQVRHFRTKLLGLQKECERAALDLKRAEERTPELIEAVKASEDALLDAVLCTVPSIAEAYDTLLNTPSDTLHEELNEAFHVIHGFYLDPLAKRLAAEIRNRARATMEMGAPLKTAS